MYRTILKRINTFIFGLLLCLIIAVQASSTAFSTVVYSYQGKNYNEAYNNIGVGYPIYNTTMSLSLSFEVASPLAPNLPLSDISGSILIYSFNDGVQVLDQTNSIPTLFLASTDANGNISTWSMQATADFPTPITVGDIYRQIGTFSVTTGARDQGAIARCISVSNGDCELTKVNLGRIYGSPGEWQQGDVSINITIDIKPGSDTNPINLRSKGVIAVAVLTSEDFDALQVDPDTVQFGSESATKAHTQVHVEDVDFDGDMDLVFHFRTQETGIQCGDTEATLTGETFDGQSFAGIDSIRTVNCKLTLTFTPVEWTIARDTHGAGIHTIYMIADVSPLVVDDLQDIGGELIWEETQITLCADPTYPPVEWGKFISIRDVGDGFLRIGDGFQSNSQGPGCDINTTMQNAFDNFGLPENACLSVRSGDINYEFCAPLNITQ